MPIRKVIIDTDAGLDDALAIFMVLAAHKKKQLEVVGITTVHGNTGVDNVNKNVLRILQTAGLLDQIPVYSGAAKSLVQPWKFDEEPFHGHDGFGDAALPDGPPVSQLQKQHAVWTLIDTAKKHSGNIVLAALGPLTNLALAIRIDQSFLSHFADIYIMGGNTTGTGNITHTGEFNFTCDPESARVVLEETPKKIHLTPWEICLYHTPLPYDMRVKLADVKTPEAELMNIIEKKVNEKREYAQWITCDQLAMAWMVDNLKKLADEENSKNSTESLAIKTEEQFALVELQGSLTRGQMVIDRSGPLRPPNLIILSEVNIELYKRYLRQSFGGVF